jgi:RNA polymerase sigma-70 factor (ECF subfamily)
MATSFDDIRVMQQIGAQDQHAFQLLYREYGAAVYSLAYRILQNGVLAEEVTQDTFLKVWQQKAQWDPAKGKLKSWLLTISHFTAVDRIRQEKRQPTLLPDAIDDLEDGAHGLHGENHWQEGTLLRLLVSHLPDQEAALIELAFFQGMTHADIAAVTRLPLGTVKTRLRSGLQRLRELWLQSNRQPTSYSS